MRTKACPCDNLVVYMDAKSGAWCLLQHKAEVGLRPLKIKLQLLALAEIRVVPILYGSHQLGKWPNQDSPTHCPEHLKGQQDCCLSLFMDTLTGASWNKREAKSKIASIHTFICRIMLFMSWKYLRTQYIFSINFSHLKK